MAKGNVVKDMASRDGHRRWVNSTAVEKDNHVEEETQNQLDDDVEIVQEDESDSVGLWLHCDTLSAISEYWADGSKGVQNE